MKLLLVGHSPSPVPLVFPTAGMNQRLLWHAGNTAVITSVQRACGFRSWDTVSSQEGDNEHLQRPRKKHPQRPHGRLSATVPDYLLPNACSLSTAWRLGAILDSACRPSSPVAGDVSSAMRKVRKFSRPDGCDVYQSVRHACSLRGDKLYGMWLIKRTLSIDYSAGCQIRRTHLHPRAGRCCCHRSTSWKAVSCTRHPRPAIGRFPT
jgi:hypothetical protein